MVTAGPSGMGTNCRLYRGLWGEARCQRAEDRVGGRRLAVGGWRLGLAAYRRLGTNGAVLEVLGALCVLVLRVGVARF